MADQPWSGCLAIRAGFALALFGLPTRFCSRVSSQAVARAEHSAGKHLPAADGSPKVWQSSWRSNFRMARSAVTIWDSLVGHFAAPFRGPAAAHTAMIQQVARRCQKE